MKTPEGVYILDWSSSVRSITGLYTYHDPNRRDRERLKG